MWFGLLTPGTHPCRPAAAPDVITLSCWNDIARVRQDGPVDDVATGLRLTREWMRTRGQRPHAPRCFTCAAPFPVPDVDEVIREADERDSGGHGPAADAPVDEVGAAAPALWGGSGAPVRALFMFVHLADEAPAAGEDEEVLLVVPVPRLALLVPLDALSRLLLLVATAFADEPASPHRCARCGALAPGHPAGDAGGHRRAPTATRARSRRRGRPAA